MPGKFSRTGGKIALSTMPVDVYLALITTPAAPDALGAEYSAEGYVRKVQRFAQPATDTDPPALLNGQGVVWGPFTNDTGEEVVGVMAMQAVAGGTYVNMIAFWDLDEPRTPEVGDTLVLDVGALALTCS